MTDNPVLAPGRTVVRVESKRRLGPDAQSDDKALIFFPGDPAMTDPFIALVEDWFSTTGFNWHPHRGIETVTTVIDGVLEHGDNRGNVGALERGDVQWMTAGYGIIHRELAYRDEHVHTLQLWLNLPATRKLTDSRYQDLLTPSRPRITRPGAVIDIVSGTVDGVSGPALNHVDVQAVMITLEPQASLAYALPAGHRAFTHVLSGQVTVAGRTIDTGQTAWSDPMTGTGDSVLLLATPDTQGPSQLMIYSGTPLREPVVASGPFVMNSRAEIVQAYADFHAGKFGDVPRQARLDYDR